VEHEVTALCENWHQEIAAGDKHFPETPGIEGRFDFTFSSTIVAQACEPCV
jgi:hypothetical protein